MTDGFLSRWSKRKLDVQSGKPVEDPPVPEALVAPISQPLAGTLPAVSAKSEDSPQPAAEQAAPLPTLADVQSLTPESDFKPFMARGVTADVKNAAMKKLFADPHFNVMDGLDTYIDDYSLSDPIPESMLRQMASAKFLNLFDDDKAESPATPTPEALRDDANTAMPQELAHSNTALHSESDCSPAHDHTDLRLQPDHAPGPPGSGPGPA